MIMRETAGIKIFFSVFKKVKYAKLNSKTFYDYDEF